MKKVIISIIALTMLFSLVSCGAPNGMDGYYGEPVGPQSPSDMADAAVKDEDYEDYGKFIENPFISTYEENVSTFAADVDTASYSYFRKLVNSGYSLRELIATAGTSVRTEEMINYFDYGYADPDDGELFSTTMQIAPCPWNENAELMILGLQAKHLEEAQKNNLVFLIDVSGSMNSADKMGLLKSSFSYLVSNLDSDDRVSIVTYSGNERVVLNGCSGSKKDMIINAVNSLKAGGSTNGEAGLKRAYQVAEENFIPGGNNRIIMASDGDLNVGISSEEELQRLVEEKRDGGVFLSVLGFGTGNYKDSKMETIANHGNGVYYYIDSESEAEKVFGNDIISTLYTIAKDVKLQLTFNKDMISAYRLVGYENRLLNQEDFLDDTKDAGELGAGHSVTVCYELILTENAKSSDEAWMNLGVRYKAPDGIRSEEENYSFGRETYTDAPSDNFKFICAVAKTAMILHESKYAEGMGLESVREDLLSIDLRGDGYKLQFKYLIEKLIDQSK